MNSLQNAYHYVSARLHPVLFSVILCMPIIVFTLPVLLSGMHTLFAGDFDMQVQMTEAAKISILHFHQFPFWNPWISGGVPLYADPQFGLITPQTFFSLFVPSAFAWKLTFVAYLLAGFFSMRLLLTHLLNANTVYLKALCIVLSYTWIFGSFFTLRFTGGHMTFLILSLLPLAIYLTLTITRSRWRAVLLGLLMAYCINAALHYSTILILLVIAMLVGLSVVYGIVTKRPLSALSLKDIFTKQALLVVGALMGALLISLPRIYMSLQYLNDNSVVRDTPESFIGIFDGVKTMAQPYGDYVLQRSTFGVFEASNYIGEITFVVLGLLLVGLFFALTKVPFRRMIDKKSVKYFAVFLGIAGISFLIGLGGPLFNHLRDLPVFSSTRVSTRYFFITSFTVIILLGLLAAYVPKYFRAKKWPSYVVVAILSVGLVQVFANDFKLLYLSWTQGEFRTVAQGVNADAFQRPIHMDKNFNVDERKNYFALTEGTLANRGQIIADNALVDTRLVKTLRCDQDDQQPRCAFVLSENAGVTYWSPNHITLHRTGPGPIHLNMNQSSHWRVNGHYIFENQKVVESNATFTIPRSADAHYDIRYAPLIEKLK